MALVVAVFLIVPMVTMVQLPGKKTALVTASMAIVVFALTVATRLSLFSATWSENEDQVLAATAAYAAVIAVFVGVSV